MEQNKILQGAAAGGAPIEEQPDPAYLILVADDDADIRRINTEILRAAGFEVECAGDGAEAWDMLQRTVYDLLLTDNNMPRMSGMELLQKIDDACKTLPAIMVTGVPPAHPLPALAYLQVEAMLLKPYTAAELLATVRKVLYAADQNTSQSNWQNQPPADDLRL